MSDGQDQPEEGHEAAPARSSVVNIRMDPETRRLIDSAAEAMGKNRSEFMTEAARRHAVDVLLDQRLFTLDPDRYDAFVAALERPPPPTDRLRALMRKRPLWEA